MPGLRGSGGPFSCRRACLARAAEPRPHPVALGQKHHEAVNRKRRIAVQYDAWSQLGHDFQEWLDYRFDYIDEPGTQIDSIWWDITAMGNSTYPSKILKPLRQVGLDRWRKQGIDWVGRLVAETRKRKREVFWSHRISEVELNDDGTISPRPAPHLVLGTSASSTTR